MRVNDLSVFAEDSDVKVDIRLSTPLNNIILLNICVKLVKSSELILEPKVCMNSNQCIRESKRRLGQI